ncbi:oligosaccharide flippase family protein [bacterium]|nr:oligosaccharide flippase family protein [bacterium]MBU3930495.1 oligosaccharide flippase family protein [bacterium]
MIKKLFRNEIFRNTLIYCFGAGFIGGLQFLLVPIYTRVMPPETYGILELLNTFIQIIALILALGLPQVLFIFYYHRPESERNNLVGEIFSLYFIVATPVVFVLIMSAGVINQAVFNNTAKEIYIILAILFAYFSVFQQTFLNVLKAQRKAVLLTALQIGYGLITVLSILYLVYFKRMGILGVMLPKTAITIIFVCLVVIFSYRLIKSVNVKLSFQKAREFLSVSVPIIPGVLAAWILNSADRWVLLKYGYVRELGLYAVAYKFGILIQILLDSFAGAYVPKLYDMYNKDEISGERFNMKFFKRYLIAGIPAFIIGILLLKLVFNFIVGEQYYQAFKYVPFVIAGYFMYGAMSFAHKLVHYHKRTMAVVTVTIVAAVFNLVTNIVFVKIYGPIAAAVTTLFSFTLLFLLMFWLRGIEFRKLKVKVK